MRPARPGGAGIRGIVEPEHHPAANRIRLDQSRAVTDVFRIALTAALATGSWFLIERPVRKEHILRATKLAFPVAAASVAVIAFAGSARVDPPPRQR